MITTVDTAKRVLIFDLDPGTPFRLDPADVHYHIRIAADSWYLEAEPGRVYSLHRGRIASHACDAVGLIVALRPYP